MLDQVLENFEVVLKYDLSIMKISRYCLYNDQYPQYMVMGLLAEG
jgi:hypothetical protein